MNHFILIDALVITNTAPAPCVSSSCALLSPGEAKLIASPAMNSVRITLPIPLAPTVRVACRLINKALIAIDTLPWLKRRAVIRHSNLRKVTEVYKMCRHHFWVDQGTSVLHMDMLDHARLQRAQLR
jgi:hypothetical protein